MKKFWWLLGVAGAFAQQFPCGFFEIDGNPGQTMGDFAYRASVWRSTDPQVDLDGDGVVTILDYFEPMSCVDNLNHGLLGKYYGYEDGLGGEISFPSFPIPFEPAVVKVTERIEEFDAWGGFLDSDMYANFAAQWDGYLFVPEDATYTLHFTGISGVRIFLDGSQVLSYDAWPYDETYVAALTEGLHPLRIEYYKAPRWGDVAMEWSSDGTVIGPVGEILDQRYLYHAGETAPQWAVSELEFLPNIPSGTRVASTSINLDAFVMSPDANVHLTYQSNELVLIDGRLTQTFSLNAGLNTFEFVLSDDAGRQKTVNYHIYRDSESVTGNGLVANLYSTEWWNSPMPDVSDLYPFSQVVIPGAQINTADLNEYYLGSTWVTGQIVMQIEGMINITQAGDYTFYSNEGGGVYINGEFICGISEQSARQWRDRGSLFLTAGRHHFRMTTGGTWNAPRKELEWDRNGSGITTVPNSAFQYGPNHFHATAKRKAHKSGGRIANALEVEYLFQNGAELVDTSGYPGRNFWPDPRAQLRSPAGVSFDAAGGFTSEQGGVHLIHAVKQGAGEVTLEADITWEGPIATDGQTRPIVVLSTFNSFGDIFYIYIRNDDLFARVENDGSNVARLDDFLDTRIGVRTHVAASYDGLAIRLYVDGVLVDTTSKTAVVTQWPNEAHFSVGQNYEKRDAYPSTNDRHFDGTIHVAAAYSDRLSASQIATNMSENLTLSPNPSPLSAPTPVTFPPLGTSQAALEEAHHVLNRLTFGPDVQSLNHILTIGVDNWIDEQLVPQSVDDSEVDAYLNSGIFRPINYGGDLVYATVYRQIASKRQMLEIMTQFWENHFNTQVSKVEELREEWDENERFRQLAFGDFIDLLRASAMNFPMTVYLDNVDNIVGAPNENYAREIFELHALGVNNGYTQADIIEASRCFTGWYVNWDTGEFRFHPGLHDFGEKNLLGITIPAGGGMSDGMAIIDHLLTMTETADFISWKLCQLLVDDDPPADVLTAASSAFQASNGNIEQTMRAILTHARFRTDTAYRGNKTRTPLEFVAALARLVEAHPMANTLADYIYGMGMNLFDYPFPTGFEEVGDFWINTNSLLVRWNFVHDLTSNRGHGHTTAVNMNRFLDPYISGTSGAGAATEINDFFVNLTSHGTEEAAVPGALYDYMTNMDPGSFVVDDATLDQAIRHTLSLYLRLPELNKQ